MSKVAAMAWLGMGFRTNDRTPCIVDCPSKVLVLVGVAEWLSLHGQSGFGLYLAKSKRWVLIGRLTSWSLVYIESFDLGWSGIPVDVLDSTSNVVKFTMKVLAWVEFTLKVLT